MTPTTIHRGQRVQFAILLVAMSLGVVAPTQAAPPAHLVAAEDLVTHVKREDSSYQHKAGVVHWKGQEGATKYECHTDCSGLLNHLLEHSYGLTQADLKSWLDVNRPTAETYHDAIAKENGFRRITRIDQALPGDILAVKYPPDSKNTGHIMIVAGRPKLRESTAPLVAGTRQWEVAVIDSSMSGHGKTDTRHNAEGEAHDGIGKGELRIYTDVQGTVVGHSWSTYRNSDVHDQKERHIEIGRLTKKPK